MKHVMLILCPFFPSLHRNPLNLNFWHINVCIFFYLAVSFLKSVGIKHTEQQTFTQALILKVI